MAVHSFDTEHAELYGVEEAILLYNIVFWISKNKANNVNTFPCKINGKEVTRTFTYNSHNAWLELFPYFKNRFRIQRAIHSLKKQRVILTENFEKSRRNHTTYYALVDEDKFISRKSKNAHSDRAKTINQKERKRSFFITDNKPNQNPDMPERGAKKKKSNLPLDRQNW